MKIAIVMGMGYVQGAGSGDFYVLQLGMDITEQFGYHSPPVIL